MFSSNNEYDRGVNTFSPEGRLFQVEYAIEAIKLGSTVIGVQTSTGIVIAGEKRLSSKLIVGSSVKKLVQISDVHIAGISGLIADGHMLLDKGRIEAENYKFTYDEHMPTESLVRRMCDFCMSFGEEGSQMSRPLGVAMLVAGLDRVNDGKDLVPILYHVDPSGTFIKYKGKAIGSGAETAQTTLQDEYNTSMTLDEAKKCVLKIMKAVMEDDIDGKNVDVWTLEIVDAEPQIQLLSGDEIKRLAEEIKDGE